MIKKFQPNLVLAVITVYTLEFVAEIKITMPKVCSQWNGYSGSLSAIQSTTLRSRITFLAYIFGKSLLHEKSNTMVPVSSTNMNSNYVP